jgi:hypothetical protein
LGEEEARKRGNTVGIRDQAMDLAALNFLPTTRAQHGEDRNNKIYARDPKQPQNLENALAVLPTPTTRDYKDGTEPHERDGVVQTDTVARAVFNSGEVLLPTTRTSRKLLLVIQRLDLRLSLIGASLNLQLDAGS